MLSLHVPLPDSTLITLSQVRIIGEHNLLITHSRVKQLSHWCMSYFLKSIKEGYMRVPVESQYAGIYLPASFISASSNTCLALRMWLSFSTEMAIT